jgi:hypothetical protein
MAISPCSHIAQKENADLMEIQRDYVGLRGEICSPLKYRASLPKDVGPKLAGDERYGAKMYSMRAYISPSHGENSVRVL